MTMADTIAVMSAGVIDQMGAPAELYEHPQTTFVANFLGQSNLIQGSIAEQSGPNLVVDVHGAKITVPVSRAQVTTGGAWVGVRPEKVHILAPGSTEDHNLLPGGVVTDVSFVGVSTQYLVRMPWGQELMIFQQNAGASSPVRAGDEVVLGWKPPHTFLLDAAQDARAGSELEDD